MKKLKIVAAVLIVLLVFGVYPLLQSTASALPSGLSSEVSQRVFSQQQQITAGNGAATDSFAFAVAIDGDTAIVGAPSDDVGANTNQGSAYVYVRTNEIWGLQQQLFASDGAGADQFGNAVALDGDTAVVGSAFDGSGIGTVYVYVRSGTTWTEQQKITAASPGAGDQFGKSVALDGDTVVIGASNDDVGANSNQGSAHVFVRSGTVWTFQDTLTASDGAASDNFGISVDVSGDTFVAGAVLDDVGANSNQGSAYVYVRIGTNWIEEQKLTSSDGVGGDFFGASVALDGDTVVVGANGDDIGANGSQGSAYAFVRSGTTWTEQQKLLANDGALNDNFGVAVALDGEFALIGSAFDDVGANVDQGSAYVFARSGTTWTQQTQLIADDGIANDTFAKAVAFDVASALVGVPDDQIGANADQGSAYVFFDPALVPTATPTNSNTPEPTDTPTDTPVITETPGDTPTATLTPSNTPTNTATLEPGTTELIVNGGFEILGGDGKPDVTPWTIKNPSGDKGTCNKDKDGDGIPDKIVAFAGNCAFQFKNVVGEAGKFQQALDLSSIVPATGDNLTLRFFAQSKGGATVKAKAIFKYNDSTKTKVVVESNGLETYTEFTGNDALSRTDITSSKVNLASSQTSGKVYVDEVSLRHTSVSLIAVPKLSSSTR